MIRLYLIYRKILKRLTPRPKRLFSRWHEKSTRNDRLCPKRTLCVGRNIRSNDVNIGKHLNEGIE